MKYCCLSSQRTIGYNTVRDAVQIQRVPIEQLICVDIQRQIIVVYLFLGRYTNHSCLFQFTEESNSFSLFYVNRQNTIVCLVTEESDTRQLPIIFQLQIPYSFRAVNLDSNLCSVSSARNCVLLSITSYSFTLPNFIVIFFSINHLSCYQFSSCDKFNSFPYFSMNCDIDLARLRISHFKQRI